jgi:hypothetical protein
VASIQPHLLFYLRRERNITVSLLQNKCQGRWTILIFFKLVVTADSFARDLQSSMRGPASIRKSNQFKLTAYNQYNMAFDGSDLQSDHP